jgi:hypothetical protein
VGLSFECRVDALHRADRTADDLVRLADCRTDSALRAAMNLTSSAATRAAQPLHWSRRMSNTRFAFTSFLASVLFSFIASASASIFIVAAIAATTACSDEPVASAPDATPSVPIDPTGHYQVTSTFSLASPPPAATDVLAELTAMSDGVDDPSRYLIDLMIDRLPTGTAKTYASAIAPYIAAYVNQRVAQIAPKFVDGTRALSTGLSRIAQRFGTMEVFDIASDGPRVEGDDYVAEGKWLSRTIIGVRFDLHAGRDVADVRFAPNGLPDIATKSVVMLDGTALGGAAMHAADALSIAKHTARLPYTRMLRLGFDFAVIPDVVPSAHDLSAALVELVDCSQLGAAVSECVGLGSPSFYATACSAGLSALATKLYARLDAIDPRALPLELAGEARAVDTNGDGPMDVISAGAWTGTFAGVPATGSFDGAAR